MRYAVLAGRVLFSLIFIISLGTHFSSGAIAYAAAKGVPFARVVVPLSGILAFAGGLSVALGFKARWGAVLLLLFLLPVTFIMHDFWAVGDAQQAQLQLSMFMKNLSLIGAALIVLFFGAGPLSVDAWLASRERVHDAPAIPRPRAV